MDARRFREAAAALVAVGRFCYERGWLPATSGNLSARLDARSIAITVSGRHKGELDETGFMRLDLDGDALSPDVRPSAEAELHRMLYRRDPTIGAVLHTHSVASTVLSRLGGTVLRLHDYEVLKAFPGVVTHHTVLEIPIFPNDQDIPRLAEQVACMLEACPALPGYLIAGHGLYTWGDDVASARRALEAFEFLFECEILTRRMSG
ncbi:methylthioribulose 1-phosphate dehydratase [Thiocapsa imhoffii]|nr:methylthioribulose 1-phosphate dehydratase [Thiocapsa imhoffii]